METDGRLLLGLGPEFKGHVTKNKDEFQKSDQLNFRYCLLS